MNVLLLLTLEICSKNTKLRQRKVRPNHINKKYEYVNLDVLKNYCGSLDKIIDENITKARKEAGMLFSAEFDRGKMNPMVYIKFWRTLD